jgi:hypothetical protein
VNVFRRPNSKYLQYDFTVRGNRYRGSTKETNDGRAEKIASLKLAASLAATDPLPTKIPRLRDIAPRFLSWVESTRLATKSKKYYQNGWRMLSATNIKDARLGRSLSEKADKLRFPRSGSNANCALRTLRRMLHKAEDWDLIAKAPKIKLAKERERGLLLDEHSEPKLLAGAAACGWRGGRSLELFTDVVVLARDTGMRDERELYAMRIEHVDWNRMVMNVPDSKTPAGKRKIPMTDRVAAVLKKRCGNNREGWVFPSKRSKSGHLTTLAGHFREARRKAGLPEELVLYCSRHDFGTRLFDKTRDLKAVMLTMGHKDVKSALRYQHPNLELVRQALNGTPVAGS